MLSLKLIVMTTAAFIAVGAPTPAMVPTARPTLSVSTTPTRTPTASPTQPSYELFAVIGGNSCAENLYYGPQAITTAGSADGNHEYFLSTSTLSRNIPHKKWLQIVTEDGHHELFRIYWAFNDQKTLANRIVNAVTSGESVSYQVVTNLNYQYSYTGTWRFSNAASISAATFTSAGTKCCFSAANGAWGGGPRTIDGNNNFDVGNKVFWGQGNFRSSDTACKTVYSERDAYTPTSTTPKSYLYYTTLPDPTVAPTRTPTSRPTATPAPSATRAPSATSAPSRARTARPTVTSMPTTDGMVLFAVVGGGSCAEDLYYGPQAITAQGSADGHAYYLSTDTAQKGVAHTDWLQVITSGNDAELFRIYWSFETARTLQDHFTAAVAYGEPVTYRVVVASTGQEYSYSGVWYFSSVAGVTDRMFSAVNTACCFSADDGAWGAGNGDVDGNDVNTIGTSSFWGIGNFDSADNPDCSVVYARGQTRNGVGGNVKSYMYYSTASVETSSVRRTVLSGFDWTEYVSNQQQYNSALSKSLAESMYGASEHDIGSLTITAYASASSATTATSAENTAASTAIADVIKEEDAAKGHVVGNIRWLGHVERVNLNPSAEDSTTEEAAAVEVLDIHAAAQGQDTVQLKCTVEVESSVYTYRALSQLLTLAVSNGDFDSTLHTYAAYYNLTGLASTSAVSIVTTELSAHSSGGGDSGGMPAGAIAAIVITVVGVCIIIWNIVGNRCGGETKRVAVDEGDFEVTALEDQTSAGDAPRIQNDAVSNWTVRPIRRANPRGAVVLPWQVSNNARSGYDADSEAKSEDNFGPDNDVGECRDTFRTEIPSRSTRTNAAASSLAHARAVNASVSARVSVPVVQIPSASPARRNSAPLVSARVVGHVQDPNVAVAVPATPRQLVNGLVVAQAYVHNA